MADNGLQWLTLAAIGCIGGVLAAVCGYLGCWWGFLQKIAANSYQWSPKNSSGPRGFLSVGAWTQQSPKPHHRPPVPQTPLPTPRQEHLPRRPAARQPQRPDRVPFIIFEKTQLIFLKKCKKIHSNARNNRNLKWLLFCTVFIQLWALYPWTVFIIDPPSAFFGQTSGCLRRPL